MGSWGQQGLGLKSAKAGASSTEEPTSWFPSCKESLPVALQLRDTASISLGRYQWTEGFTFGKQAQTHSSQQQVKQVQANSQEGSVMTTGRMSKVLPEKVGRNLRLELPRKSEQYK